jgi:PAS domain S-box-containing protein
MRHDAQNHQSMTIERFLALSQVGTALMRELDEERLLHLIAQTACELTGAAFAAFSLRPVDEEGQPPVPAEGALFHLAAVVGITAEQEAHFRRMPLGGEGLLAPIFRQGVPVRVADVLAHLLASGPAEARETAQQAAYAYAQGQLPADALPSLGVPAGHPVVRSFQGVPLLDRSGEVRGGLLLGHGEPDRFTEEDQIILVSLAGQAAVALENARLYHLARLRAQELQVLFDGIADGITLVDGQGRIRRENAAASQVRRSVLETPQAGELLETLLYAPARAVLQGADTQECVVQVRDARGERREYLVTAWLLRALTPPSEALSGDVRPPSPRQAQLLSSAVVIWHDLAEQRLREAAQAAQERARYLEAIFAAMMDGVYVYDAQGRIVQMNTAANALLARTGTPETAALPIQERLANIVVTTTGEERLTAEQLPIARMLHGERYPSERAIGLQVPTRDGDILSITVTGGPLRDAQGQIIGAVLMARDVTEQQRAERLREEQAQQLRLQASLIALAHDAILVMDPHSRIVSWNRGAEQLYGWTAQQAQGQVTDTLLQTRFPVSQDSVARLLHQEGQWEGELVHTCRDGHLAVVESRQVLLRDVPGQPSAILQINRDIGERRRLERFEREVHAQMEDRLGLLQMILNELPSAIYLARGPQARLVLANRATTSVFGATWTPGQPLQAFLAQHGIRVLRSDGRPLAPEHMGVLRALRQGETVRQQQKVIWHPDGTTLPVLVNVVLLDAAQVLMPAGMEQAAPGAGEAERVALVIYQDVTALKEAEALKDEFLSIATHELRSPVAVLKGYADMLLRQSARGRGVPLNESQQEGLREISQTATHLDDLSRDLLDISQLQAEQPGRFAKPTDLVALVERVVKRQQATTHRHHLRLHTAHRPLTVNIDPKRLEQVLVNLLDNAIKYSPQGGPVEAEVSRGTQNEEEVALLSIRDHGMGIPAQQQARIFGRFVRAENARTTGIAGTGLGLYLSRELVERNGGHIWFESTEGVGSTFFVALPLMAEPA